MVHGLETIAAINDRAMERVGVQALAAKPGEPNRVNAIHQPGENPAEYAVVDVLGRQCFAGRLSAQVVAGTAFVKVESLNANGDVVSTRLIGGGSIYMIEPISESTYFERLKPGLRNHLDDEHF